MEMLWQLEARWLARGILVATLAAFSVAAEAQSNASSTPPSAAPTPGRTAIAPPPADLEPGVNTSATQTSSAEPAPAPAPAQKPAPTPAKPAKAAGAASAGATSGLPSAPNATAVSPAANAPAAAPAAGAAGTARTSAVPKSGAPGAPTAAAGKAHDSLQLDTTQITGNRELPKVLYIVPWKRSDLGDLVGKPVNSLLDEVLTPVDRDVFKRQNRYYDALKPDAAKDAAGAAAGADVKH